MDENELPAPAEPATPPVVTNVVKIRDFLTKPAGLATVLKRRRALTRTGFVIDHESLIRAPKRAPVVREYLKTLGDLPGATPMALPVPTPLLKDRKAELVRWVLARASESSSWRGIFLVAGAVGFVITEEQSESLIALAMALSGAIGVFFADKPGEAE